MFICSRTYRKLCIEENCNKCFEKSFASHPRSQFWSSKNEKNPREIFKNSGKKHLFNCDKCNHEFKIRIIHISKGHWCSVCKNKTEKLLFDWLKDNYGKYLEIKHQVRFQWCKNINTGRILPFDFCIHEKRIIIELDGEQHFSQVSNWKCPFETQKRDIFKMKKSIENGWSVIRLLQEDVLYNTNDWEIKLFNCINNTVVNTPQCIYNSPRYMEILSFNNFLTDKLAVYGKNKDN